VTMMRQLSTRRTVGIKCPVCRKMVREEHARLN
jgi:hypothetical protein